MNRLFTLTLAAAVFSGCKEKTVTPVYQTLPVVRRDIVVSVNATGTVQPVDSVEIKSKASGEITAIHVQTGQEVKKGQLLLQVDPRNPRNALAQARANLEVAQAQQTNALSQLKRAEELWATKSITEQEYDNAKLQGANTKASVIKAQQTDLENARISYEDTDVRAPKDGIVLTRSVGVGTVIQSATGGVSGGQVLLKMANLDSVQIRALVDETDIGKLSPGMPVSITVDAYPNRPFAGTVQKIEPQSIVQQQVTMFPVMVRLPNPDHLLRPGMNAEIAITVGERRDVTAVQNSALRTQRDVASAAGVLGLSMDDVQKQLAAATPRSDSAGGQASMGGEARSVADSSKKGAVMIATPDGREIPAPEGFSAADAKKLEAVFAKMRSAGGFQSLSDDDRQLMQRFRQAGGGGGMGGGRGDRGGAGGGTFQGSGGGGTMIGGGGGMVFIGGPGGGAAEGGDRTGRLNRSARRQQQASQAFGGNFIVFVQRDGQPAAVNVRTGLTDLDYSEVISGLTDKDTVLVLPSASLVQAQEQSAQMRNRMSLPGMGGGGGAVRR